MIKIKLSLTAAACTLGLVQSQSVLADFVADGKANLSLRNYYFNNDYRNGHSDAGTPSFTEEWAQGFMLDYKSGFTDGTLGVGLDVIGLMAQKLDSGRGRHRGGSMIPGNSDESPVDNWSRAGATGKLRMSNTELRIGTLIPMLPILMSNDGRVLTQTFEGVMVTSNEISGLTLNAGQIEHAVGRASTNRTGLAVQGGTRQSNQFYFAGGSYEATADLKLQYYFAELDNYYTQHFGGLVHLLRLSENQSFKSDLRYFKSDSTGGNSSGKSGYQVSGYTHNGDGRIDNDTWSTAFTYLTGSHSFMVGYQRVSSGSSFVHLNQGSLANEGAGGASSYLLTERLITLFNRAGENTLLGQYAYDFAGMGVPRLKGSVIYLKGDNIEVNNGKKQSEWERDVGLDYVFQSGTLKGLGLAWRNGMLRSEATRDQDQNRLIVSYTVALF